MADSPCATWSKLEALTGPANAPIQNNSGLPQGLAGHLRQVEHVVGIGGPPEGSKPDARREAARVHIAARRRGGCLAARSACRSRPSGCGLFVGLRFPDDWRLIVALLILLIFIFFVIIVVGISRRHRVIHEGGKPPIGQDKNVLSHARGHFLLDVATLTDGC
jgi:hypothetical protein